jgi:DNA-binding transcriptional ArsR family regulator
LIASITKLVITMETKQIYMRFLNLLHALEGGENAPEMDLEAKKLLEVIAVHEANKNPLTVTAAMNLGHIASPATIHRKLDVLRELGMIDTVFEGKNRRTKYLVPTQAAHDYFDSVGKAMTEALAQH